MIRLGVATVHAELDAALMLGASALAFAERENTAALVSASLKAEALVLGRLQRADTLASRSTAQAPEVLRRHSTGTEARLSGAVLYHALALPRVDALYADASARTLLNRNLRALLRGYTKAGVPLRYFGTEVLALLGHPVALVGYDQSAAGGVLIEVLIGLENPCVVRPALRREPPASLFEVLRSSPEPDQLLERAVAGIVERLEAEAVEVALPAAQAAPPLLLSAAPCSVSIPLGVVEAVTTPQVRITGDLLVSSAALSQVEALAQRALAAGEPLSDVVLSPLQGAPLDGARPADLLQALRG